MVIPDNKAMVIVNTIEIICLTVPATICAILILFIGQKYESSSIGFFVLFVFASVVIFIRHLILVS